MVILAINTAIKNPCIGLVVGDVSKELSLGSEQNQTENLIPIINSLLQEFSIDTQDITQIVVVSGPGSFTALRIGIIAANTFAINLNIPLFAVTTFEYLKLICNNLSPTVIVHAGGDSVYKENGEIILIEEFLNGYNGEPVAADLSQEQMENYSLKLNLVSDKLGFADIAKKIVSKNEYKVMELPLAPNYIKLPNISSPKL